VMLFEVDATGVTTSSNSNVMRHGSIHMDRIARRFEVFARDGNQSRGRSISSGRTR
jgi:hypothetical protein